MILPVVVLLIVCGGFLVTGGILLGSDTTAWIGYAMWGWAGLLVLRVVWIAVLYAWRERKLRQRMAKLRGPRAYRPNAGLR